VVFRRIAGLTDKIRRTRSDRWSAPSCRRWLGAEKRLRLVPHYRSWDQPAPLPPSLGSHRPVAAL